MKALSNCIGIKEGGLTHKRSFLNQRETARDIWFNRRRFDVK